MNIIVTGGTGFIGKRLVRRLLSQEHAVTVLTRDPARATRELPARCNARAWKPGGRVNRVWHHTHEFEPVDGGTIVRDRVRYALPFGPLGELFGGRFVTKDLHAIFDFRRERITEALS